MSEVRKTEPTPVDEVRRVRARLDQEFGGDVRRLAAHAREVTEKLRLQLGLKWAERDVAHGDSADTRK